jgi:hypothetical protein
MKNFRLINWVALALMAISFTSCNNEPLVGEFIQQSDPTLAEAGQFKAQIDGVEFIATVTEAVLTTDNLLYISGILDTTGESITLVAADAAVGALNLIADNGTENRAVYYPAGASSNPYVSLGTLGGSGQLTLTEINTTDLTLTGSFSFIGKRVQLDANGDPILDGNGAPVIQTISVTPGVFNAIPYIIDDTGGTGGGTGGDPVDEFTALIDGVEFFEDSLDITITTIGAVEMIKIIAQTSTNSLIRIDLPLFTGVGTFPMEPLSDGTKIIGLYNSNTGGENLTSNPGSITITELDTEAGKIVATFEFTGKDPLGGDPTVVQVTEGAFTFYFEGIPGSGPKPFTAEVDSVLYEPDPADIGVTTTLQGGVERVTLATTFNAQSMSLTFPKNITVGSYEMSTSLVSPETVIAIYNPMSGSTPNFVSSPGMITIVSYDTMTGKIAGTFSYTAVDVSGGDPTTYNVANGEFRITIE